MYTRYSKVEYFDNWSDFYVWELAKRMEIIIDCMTVFENKLIVSYRKIIG